MLSGMLTQTSRAQGGRVLHDQHRSAIIMLYYQTLRSVKVMRLAVTEQHVGMMCAPVEQRAHGG